MVMVMKSLETGSPLELKKVARVLGVELDGAVRKKDILEKLYAANVTWEDYVREIGGFIEDAPAPEPAEIVVNDVSPSEVILTMAHKRAGYKIEDYLFTQDKPFVLLSFSEANRLLVKSPTELRQATPQEVADYYGRIE